jgi:solute:Na+ symporter, SSS family
VLRVARLAAVAGGAGGVASPSNWRSIISALTIFYTLLSVSLFVPVIAGLYTRRPRRARSAAAIGTGVVTV